MIRSPGRSPGTAIILSPASALALVAVAKQNVKVFTLKFLM